MRYLGAITNDYDLVTKKYVDDATEVIQTLTSGTKIGSVGGVNLYAPTGGGSGTVTSVGITNGGGLSISGSPITSSGSITVGHSNNVTAGTIGSTSATSGASISIPYATYDGNGHITGKGTHTHTITGFLSEETDPIFTASTAYYISDSDVDKWNNKLDASGLFKIVTVEVSNTASIAAHGYQGAQTVTVPSASRPAGMTLVGIVGQSTTNYRLASTTCYVNGAHSISANMANTSGTSVAANNTITFYLLYIKATSA